ncbi:MAG: hypothetical protein PHR26_02600 [Candidatus ainarchaeum sp.]|nr:hypothetical protein [Candidatus ainarchaeum sp.]MDD3976160.1 hypothetical protein [Candidatus ainarchaeum sp.]
MPIKKIFKKKQNKKIIQEKRKGLTEKEAIEEFKKHIREHTRKTK